MNEYLYHDGVKGRSGRYPWGSGDRPYQRLEGSGGGFLARRRERKAKRHQERMLEEARARARAKKEQEEKELQEAVEKEARKQDVLRKGTATEVMQYQGQLTNKELQDVVDRLRLEKNLKEYASGEIKSNFDTIDDIMKKVGKVSAWADTGIKVYDQVTKIYNATESGKANPRKTIGNSGNNNEKKKK